MPRYIDAELAVKLLHSDFDMQELYLPIHFEEFVIDGVPSADVRPAIRAHWEYPFNPFIRDIAECSACDFCVQDKINNVAEIYKYCPNCGAEMEEEEG